MFGSLALRVVLCKRLVRTFFRRKTAVIASLVLRNFAVDIDDIWTPIRPCEIFQRGPRTRRVLNDDLHLNPMVIASSQQFLLYRTCTERQLKMQKARYFLRAHD